MNNLGGIARHTGDLAKARELLLAAVELNKELGNEAWESMSLSTLGIVAAASGDLRRGAGVLRADAGD